MGLTTVGDYVYMLTWRSHSILKFSLSEILQAADDDSKSPNEASKVSYEQLDLPHPMKQAWGLSNDSKGRLYISDGTNEIYVVDPASWQVETIISVRTMHGNDPVSELNELEVVDDKWIFANQYTENEVL